MFDGYLQGKPLFTVYRHTMLTHDIKTVLNND
jgi:hypothetical protein